MIKNEFSVCAVLSFIIGTLLKVWGYLTALLHLGYMQKQHRTKTMSFDISSLNHSQIQLICSRLTYQNDNASARVRTICGIAFEAVTMNESVEDVICSR